MLKSLFNKVVCLKVCNFIKKILQHSCFPMNTKAASDYKAVIKCLFLALSNISDETLDKK